LWTEKTRTSNSDLGTANRELSSSEVPLSDRFVHPLVERNASEEMIRLWSPQEKFSTWRRLWLAMAEAQRELGLSRVTDEALAQMRANLDNIDFAKAAEHEKRTRHDLMAHVHTFGEAAPAAAGIIHLGATSMDVVDNADVVLLHKGLGVICSRLANLIDALATFAVRHRDLPTLGFTHFQPAQPVTVGKRAALWCQDFVVCLEELERRRGNLKLRGLKGATGSQASYLSLFSGDHAKVVKLEELFAKKLGFVGCWPLAGQVYPRHADAMIIGDLAALAAAAHKTCNDLRLLASMKEIEEPIEDEQVGSSAMAYKRNPMRCERATGLARYLIALAASPLQTAAEQWLERTLDDSSNRRLVTPEAFLAADGILLILINVSRGLDVYPAVIGKHLADELPFMITEELLMAGSAAGGDRQKLHEAVRRHSRAAAEQVKRHGKANDLVERLKKDPAFAGVNIDALMDGKRHTGRCAEQTDAFVREFVEPIRKRYAGKLGAKAELKV
jgi:adenylosuccinate lyase